VEQFSHDGFTFDVDDAGPPNGPVVVLLHGFPENRTSWAAITPALADAGFRVVAADQRGYSPGARPLDRRSYAMHHIVADTLALVDATGAAKVHLVGHDWGGAAAWAFAHQHADRLHTVTSLTTPHPKAMMKSLVTSTQGLRSYYIGVMQLPVLPERAITRNGGADFQRSLVSAGLPAEAAERYVRPLQAPGAATGAVNWYRGLPFSRPLQGRVEVPALYVYASNDKFLGRRAADLTADYVAAPYNYEVLADRSHWLPEEAPDDIARLLVEHARTYAER
jgi:pimeloyl-ACP methyl ester carboxylesterase